MLPIDDLLSTSPLLHRHTTSTVCTIMVGGTAAATYLGDTSFFSTTLCSSSGCVAAPGGYEAASRAALSFMTGALAALAVRQRGGNAHTTRAPRVRIAAAPCPRRRSFL